MILKKMKNAILALGSICFVCVIVYITYQAYFYHHPQFTLGNANSSDAADYHFSVPVIEVRESVFGMSDHAADVLKEFSNNNAAFAERISSEYEKPIHIDYDVRYEDGRTIFSFSGTACSKMNQEIVHINEELVFGFIAKAPEK